jgi:hypothetical protein
MVLKWDLDKQVRPFHTMEYYSATKRHELQMGAGGSHL